MEDIPGETIATKGSVSTTETENEEAEIETEGLTKVGKKTRPGRPRESKNKRAAKIEKVEVAGRREGKNFTG